MKTYRFGVNLGPSRSRAEWVEKAQARGSWLFDVDRAGAPNTQLKPLAVWLSSACGPAADHGMAAVTDAAILSRLDLHRPGRFAVIAG